MTNKKPYIKRKNFIFSLSFSLIVTSIIATVFTFIVPFFYAPIEKSEAISVTASFSDYSKLRSKGVVQLLMLSFHNHTRLRIDRTCINDKLISELDNMEAYTQVSMLVHPNSNNIMELSYKGKEILTFEYAKNKMSFVTDVFFYLGLILYMIIFCNIYKYIKTHKNKFASKHLN